MNQAEVQKLLYRGNRKATWLIVGLGVLLISAAAAVGLKYVVGQDAVVKTTSQVTPSNKVSRQAYDWGVRTCIDPISRVSDFLTNGRTYSAMSLRGNKSADAQLFSAVVAAPDQASKSESLSLLAVAPVSGGGCNSIYQTVTSFDVDCQTAHGSYFTGFSKAISFNGKIKAFSTDSGESFAYFLPISSKACVVMKMQALF
jgi:hypothetical protein